SDGTLGIKAIKEHGGLTVAQGKDGRGPMQSGMPDSAIAAGVVDLILPVEDMGRRLTEYAENFGKIQKEAPPPRNGYRALYPILLRQTGHDSSGYKESTFQRRVRRRMQVLQIDELAAYIDRLRQDSDEVTALFHDLLIGVTKFFRDADAFEALEKIVVP